MSDALSVENLPVKNPNDNRLIIAIIQKSRSDLKQHSYIEKTGLDVEIY